MKPGIHDQGLADNLLSADPEGVAGLLGDQPERGRGRHSHGEPARRALAEHGAPAATRFRGARRFPPALTHRRRARPRSGGHPARSRRSRRRSLAEGEVDSGVRRRRDHPLVDLAAPVLRFDHYAKRHQPIGFLGEHVHLVRHAAATDQNLVLPDPITLRGQTPRPPLRAASLRTLPHRSARRHAGRSTRAPNSNEQPRVRSHRAGPGGHADRRSQSRRTSALELRAQSASPPASCCQSGTARHAERDIGSRPKRTRRVNAGRRLLTARHDRSEPPGLAYRHALARG